jgi:enoyl-CoA hydratase/carnithine racemase
LAHRDNPAKLNALSPGMSEDALNVIEAYEADPAIRVVIIRGAGRRAFTAADRNSPVATSSAHIQRTGFSQGVL